MCFCKLLHLQYSSSKGEVSRVMRESSEFQSNYSPDLQEDIMTSSSLSVVSEVKTLNLHSFNLAHEGFIIAFVTLL